jgi:hypothetical protein
MSSDQVEFARYIWGADVFDRRQDILRALAKHPIKTKCDDPYQLSRRDLWILRFRQSVEVLELKMRLGWSSQQFVDALRIALPEVSPLNVNYRSKSLVIADLIDTNAYVAG